jgi:alanyl-tRNA synthetase
MYRLVDILVKTMGDHYAELKVNQQQIERVIKGEEESFLHTMERGIEQIDIIIKNLKQEMNEVAPVISGANAFLLYDTFGFPLDLTELIARENGVGVDIAGFDEKMAEQKERSRSARKVLNEEVELPNLDVVTEFVGYDNYSYKSKVLYAKDNLIVFDKTPFYVESGGQIADKGII